MQQKFNRDSRTSNTLKASLSGVAAQFVTLLMGFAYRTVFLYLLSKEYLGLNGLFSNILNLLSLAELGVGAAIVYRLYAHIKDENVEKIAAYMRYYKNVYRIIAGVVLLAGLVLMPFLNVFIKDMSEVPADINLQLIYFLFVLRSVSSYLFSYKRSLWTVDQRNHLNQMFTICLTVGQYGAQMLVLFLTRNFTVTLLSGIIITILFNMISSLLVSRQYAFVFRHNTSLQKAEKKQIFNDTKFLLLHNVAAKVVFSTDNILLSAFIGIGVLGIYSNYSLLIVSMTGFITQLLKSFISTIGNLHVSSDADKKADVYYKLLFLNFWVAGFCTIGLFVLINPFIQVWQNADMLLEMSTVLVLCISFFISESRAINGAFIQACGLFRKDWARPFIEIILNLIVSITLVLQIGIAGIFIGTIVSSLATAFWREPYILHKYEFKRSAKRFWVYFLYASFITLGAAALTFYICSLISDKFLIVKFLVVFIVPNSIFIIATFWTKEFKYYARLLLKFVKKIFGKLSGSQKNGPPSDPFADASAPQEKEPSTNAESEDKH